MPTFDPNHPHNDAVTLEEAAQRLGESPTAVRRMIAEKKLPASQIVVFAPWQIPVEALDSEKVRRAVARIKNRIRSPQTQSGDGQQPMFSERY